MHITSGLSPVSGEFLDYTIHLYGDGVEQCGSTYYAVENEVPESSHTVEIEYVFEQPQLQNLTQANVDADPQLKTKLKEEKDTEKPWFEMFKIESVRTQKRKPIKRVRIDDSETDLTNLTWLQNITNILPMPQFPMEPMSPSLPPLQPVTPQVTRLMRFNKSLAKCQKDFMDNKEFYRNNDKQKPPYSYCMLICMALHDNHDKITLAAIYSWIKDNFKYYRRADPSWQNSIRHNLSLNNVFVKVARSKDDKGKGGFWKLDLARLEGSNRMSNRPTHKKKKAPTKTSTQTEESIAVSNIPNIPCSLESEVDKAVLIHLPEIDYGIPSHMPGGNVIVQSAEPPPLVPDEDLSNIMMNPTDWGDLELDILDNYLEPW